MSQRATIILAALRGAGWFEPAVWSFCPLCGVKIPRKGRHYPGCPVSHLPDRTDPVAIVDAVLTLKTGSVGQGLSQTGSVGQGLSQTGSGEA